MTGRSLRYPMALLASVLMLLLVSGCGGGGGSGATLVAITISPGTPTLDVGETLQLNATGTYSDGTSSDLTGSVKWSLSNSSVPDVATITGSQVTALDASGATIPNGSGTIAAGTTTISASASGLTRSTTLTVIATSTPYVISSWSTTGRPTGVAVASFSNFSGTSKSGSNNVYVTDATNSTLRVYNRAGTQIASWSTTGYPQGVAVDTNNNLYVLDISNHLLRTYTSTGTTPYAATPTLTLTGSPSGVAVDSAFNVYVTDFLNKQVLKHSPISNPAGVWSTFVSTNWVPSGIAVDAHNNVYVTDISNSQVHIFDPTGHETAASPLAIAGYAYGVAVDAPGSNVFVGDYAGSLVLQYGPPGSPITLASGYTPYGVAADNAGNVYVTDFTNNQLHKYQSQ